MKEIGMMYQPPLVGAILAGLKTQTRRVAKLPHMNPLGKWEPTTVGGPGGGRTRDGKEVPLQAAVGHTRTGDVICAPIQAGDRIYVRETFWAWGRWETRFSQAKGRDEWHFVDMTVECGHRHQFEDPQPGTARRRADGGTLPAWWKRPGILMPKSAARIWLEVTGVRAERLQCITDSECWAEGAIASARPDQFSVHSVLGTDGAAYLSPRGAFSALWESTGGDWAANPLVWVYGFKRAAGSQAAPAETLEATACTAA